MKSSTRRGVLGVATFLVLTSVLLFICEADHKHQEGCKESCSPYQIRDCSWGSTVLCYTDKPGIFAEKPKK